MLIRLVVVVLSDIADFIDKQTFWKTGASPFAWKKRFITGFIIIFSKYSIFLKETVSVHICACILCISLTTELRPCAGIMIEKYFTQLQRLFFFQCQIDFLTYSLGATVRVYEVKLSRKYPLETRKVGRWPVYEGVVVWKSCKIRKWAGLWR